MSSPSRVNSLLTSVFQLFDVTNSSKKVRDSGFAIASLLIDDIELPPIRIRLTGVSIFSHFWCRV